jgi:uncharacterized membrane protein YheB (UPF0754 family)
MNKSLVTNLLSISLIGVSYASPVFQENLRAMGLYSFSGAITNWLAVHMLFEKVPGLYGSGIITERFQEFKTGIRSLVMNQFFTKENFEKFMSESSSSILNIEEEAVVSTIDFDKVFEKLKSAIMESPFGSMIGMFGGPAALDGLKPQFEIKFKEIISDIIRDENFISNLTSKSESQGGIFESIEELVDGRLNELTPKMVKDIIQDMIRDHLGWLVVWGGVFGALIGLITTLL